MTTRRAVLATGAAALAAALAVPGRAADLATDYVPETDPLVRARLREWHDWKFGFMSHWGTYSQWGVVESWSICSEDVPWCRRPPGVSYVDYKRKYEALPKTFNPVRFDPARWASIAEAAGMRYVVFTTKHHDGFAMFDTRQSDYRITAPDVPFHTNPRANVTRAVFDAFRARGLGIGAYFSKPDWHHPDYWSPEWATPDRNVNYDTRRHPERWQRFVRFVHRQIGELTSQYGRLDILWLDGGWVNPWPHPDAVAGSGVVPWPQDIDMPGLAALARRHQPGLIVVDRAVGGPYEDYRTPEQTVPDEPLPYPWETCMTLGNSWSYAPNDDYKSARTMIHILVDVVAKGGNLLLNVGADASGELPSIAVERLREIGAWMTLNGAGIYSTRPMAPYREGKLRFTKLADGTVNAIYLLDEGDAPPSRLRLSGVKVSPEAQLRILGAPERLSWQRVPNGIAVDIPPGVRHALSGAYALTLQIRGPA